MTEDKKIRKGLGPRRGEVSYQTQRDIVIPAGTILRDNGTGEFSCQIGIGLVTVHGKFTFQDMPGNGDIGTVLKRVVA